MADTLVPVGRHFFSPADLDRQLAKLPADVKADRGGIQAGIDADGAHVGFVYSIKNGRIVARGALAWDWTGDRKAAGDVLVRF